MEDITINVTLPDELSASETNFKIPILKTNETKEYKVTVESNNSVIIPHLPIQLIQLIQ